MRALNGRVLLKAYLNQKDAITIKGEGGKTIELWLGKKYETNNRKKSPTIAEVVDNNSGLYYIQKGDLVLVHHNLLSEPMQNQFCIEYDPQSGMGLFSIKADRNIFCKLDKDGNAHPVCGNLLVKRLKNPVKTNLIIVPDTVKQEHNDRVKVTEVSPEITDIKVGQTVLMYKMSDYEIHYTWEKEERSVIKIWAGEVIDGEYETGDIIGIVND